MSVISVTVHPDQLTGKKWVHRGFPGKAALIFRKKYSESLNPYLITHDPQPASRADMASEGLPRLHA
ncbi:hypothetical protein NUK49_21895, partial [Aeromonas caviae]|uniref:hypothetical protein n=1 Tax=Aeromonas caviae TaxID=648 RepID=UPI00214F4D21